MKFFALALLAYAVQTPAPTSSEIHPAFVMSSEELLKVWQKGFDEASKKRDSNQALHITRRGIGKIRVAPLREETVSWLWYWDNRQMAYLDGFDAKKKYLSPEEVEEQKEFLRSPFATKPTTMEFYGILSIYPSFGGSYATVSRHADPSDLSDVRVVLKIGDRIYYPRVQPGQLEPDSGTSSNTVAIPQQETTRTESTASGSAYGPGGSVHGSASGTSTSVRSYTRFATEDYDWYQGYFSVTFDLYEEDGTPRVLSTDKEFTVIVIYGPNERKATYKLADLQKLFR